MNNEIKNQDLNYAKLDFSKGSSETNNTASSSKSVSYSQINFCAEAQKQFDEKIKNKHQTKEQQAKKEFDDKKIYSHQRYSVDYSSQYTLNEESGTLSPKLLKRNENQIWKDDKKSKINQKETNYDRSKDLLLADLNRKFPF